MEGKIKEERRLNGPKAVIECTEDIPCNPCATCCPQKAISVTGAISSLPELDEEKCTGCGICIAKCPGMAIFVVDSDYSETEGLVSFPHEFLPMPAKGDAVKATDRDGHAVCDGVIHRVTSPAGFDHTAVVTVRVPKEFVNDVRGIARQE